MKIILRPYWEREDGFAATTTALIMGAVAVAGAATTAYGAYSSGQAQKQAMEFNSKVAQNNAIAEEQQADANAKLISDKNRRLRGSQIAELSAAGVDPTTGSGADVQYDSAVQGELNRLTTLYKAKVGANASQSQAQLDEMSGESASAGGALSAAGSILGGTGTAIYDYAMVKNNPNFGGNN